MVSSLPIGKPMLGTSSPVGTSPAYVGGVSDSHGAAAAGTDPLPMTATSGHEE